MSDDISTVLWSDFLEKRSIEKYNPERDVKFNPYASICLRDTVVGFLRAKDIAPFSLRQKVKRLEDAFSTLEIRLERIATETDVADFLSMRVDNIGKILDEAHTLNLICLNDVLNGRRDSPSMVTEDLFEQKSNTTDS